MSPAALIGALTPFRFPRVSGDEPVARMAHQHPKGFSPRERG